ncbi:unnamed protein product [Heterobilharzia americana]|nr:unnamed protein product [Heterobilharzia americana]CAH8628770.1 unnamed protein product [Heterobilharzia americana]
MHFLGCFNLIEEYRNKLITYQYGFVRDIIVYHLTKSLEGIKCLREDLESMKSLTEAPECMNATLYKGFQQFNCKKCEY